MLFRTLRRGALGFAITLVVAGAVPGVAAAKGGGSGPFITITDASLIEGDVGSNDMVFTVSLSSQTGRVVTVDFTTAGETATPGVDFYSTSGTVTFNQHQKTGTIRIPVIGDAQQEPDETFTVTLSNNSSGVIDDGTAVGTILDDDTPPPTPAAFTVTKTALVDDGNGGLTEVSGTVAPGTDVSYAIAIQNSGESDGTTDVVDDIDDRVTVDEASISGGGSLVDDNGDLRIEWQAVAVDGSLSGGSTTTDLTYTATMPTAFASGDSHDGCGSASYAVFNDVAVTGGSASRTVCVKPPTATLLVDAQTVNTSGTTDGVDDYGTGTVTSDPAGIDCTVYSPGDPLGSNGDCSEVFPVGTTVTLTATPEGDVVCLDPATGSCAQGLTPSSFEGWGGACSSAGTNLQCVITIESTAPVYVSATFGPPPI